MERCMCGDPYCPSCGDPGLARQEAAADELIGLVMDELDVSPAEWQFLMEVIPTLINALREGGFRE